MCLKAAKVVDLRPQLDISITMNPPNLAIYTAC
jgi:hypothetical protein